MELAGTAYLANLSVLGISFATVSTLVMLLRQVMGGTMSSFDIYLMTSYVTAGFMLCFAALLPSLFDLCGLPQSVTWSAASAVASLPIGWLALAAPRRRRVASGGVRPPLAFRLTIALFWISSLILFANAAVPDLHHAGRFAMALTVFLATLMWTFTRRIASLLSGSPGRDWDPGKG
jgi:hypothetical protein